MQNLFQYSVFRRPGWINFGLVQVRKIFIFGLGVGLPILSNASPLPVPLNPADGRISSNLALRSMQVRQSLSRETFDWQQFNINKGYRVDFKQPSASSIALNRIHQNDPSKIFGELNANGQVYLLNTNGFVFGKDSRVNTKTLIATTHNISDEVLQRGVTRVFDEQQQAALEQPLDADGNPLPMGNIVVENGARITTGENGQIILAAPRVTNSGTLKTENGQVIVAGSQGKVYLSQADANTGVQGLLVEVDVGGLAENTGTIDVGTGNATMIGFAVNQKGRVSAKTSVDFGGQIRLLARESAVATSLGNARFQLDPSTTERSNALNDGLGTQAKVTFGANSVTEVTPDFDSGGSAIDGQAQPVSTVQVMGHQIEMESGSSIVAPSGHAEMIATENPRLYKPNVLGPNKSENELRNSSLSQVNDARIVLANGSKIDVSGTTNTILPMERNVVSVKLTANELRNSPLQKGGFLDRKTIRVDTRIGTPIADISAEVAKISRPLSERTSSGGTVSMLSEGDVMVQQGAVVDISGGSVAFEPGFIDTTLLVTDDGRVVPIGQADPNIRYVAILGEVEKTYEKWGETLTWIIQGLEGHAKFEPGYVEGKAAGVFEIIAPQVAFDGELVAGSETSRRQRELENVAFGGEFYLNLATNINSRQSIRLVQHGNSALAGTLDDFLSDPTDSSQVAALELDNQFFSISGLSQVSLISNGLVTMENASSIQMLPGTEINVNAGKINWAGQVDIRSGIVNLETNSRNDFDGSISVEPTARIDLSGEWVNDSPLFDVAGLDPIAIDGGTFKISAIGDLLLKAGSVIDVRGGARLSESSQFIPGVGGNVELEAAGLRGSNLVFESTVQGHAFEQGGTFSLATNEIIVSDNAVANQNESGLFPTVIRPEFLEQAGFSQYNLTSNINGLSVQEGTALRLVQTNRVVESEGTNQSDSLFSKRTGTELENFVSIVERPQFERNPVNLKLELAQSAGKGPRTASVAVGSGAVIRTDPGAKVELISDGNINFDGVIDAPSGVVDLTITGPQGIIEPGFVREQAIWLGNNSAILARGLAQEIPQPSGLRSGRVLPGGTVSIDSQRGFIVFQDGALIDVSGATGEFDLPVLTEEKIPGFEATVVASDAGSVNFLTSEGAFLDGTLVASAASDLGAASGRLNIDIDPIRRGIANTDLTSNFFPITPSEIRISAGNALHTPVNFKPGDAITSEFDGLVLVNDSTLTAGGMESLRLYSRDQIAFESSTSLQFQDTIILEAPSIQSNSPVPATVDLSASYLRLGFRAFDGDSVSRSKPTSGAGSFQANANLIELVGTSALQGFNQASLNSAGDIRLRGTIIQDNQDSNPNFIYSGEFAVDGNLTFKANQIYPTTYSDFLVDVVGNPGSVLSIIAGGQSSPVLSAGGRMRLNAPNIVHQGVLKAPLGSIELNASNDLLLTAGSEISVSAEGELIPFGRVQGGLNWVYPLPQSLFAVFDSDNTNFFPEPPRKSVRLNGSNVSFQPGAEINVDGGGDLYAFEVVRGGPGGSRDELDPRDPDVLSGFVNYQEKFAILPGLQGQFAPYDHLEFPDSGLNVGDNIFLHGTAGLAAGNYALLPAHYALLPGAVLVTPVENTQDIIPGIELTRLDGAPIVAGYRFRAGTNNRDSRVSGFAIEDGSIARTRSDFIDYTANQFFSEQALAKAVEIPRIPADAGTISISAASSLDLGGQLLARPQGAGRGGQLDIQARNLAIVSQAGNFGAGVVEVVAGQLNNLDVASLLIGGSRKQTRIVDLFPDDENPGARFVGNRIGGEGSAVEFVAGSDSVTLGSGVSLNFAETILVAKDTVTMESGSSLSSLGKTDKISEVAAIRGDAAIIRVNNSDNSAFARANFSTNPTTGNVTIQKGAILDSGQNGSILVDAPSALDFNGNFSMTRGSLALRTSAIDLGTASGRTGVLVVDQRLLTGLNVAELYLDSLSGIHFGGSLGLGSGAMDIDLSAPLFSGSGTVGDVFQLNANRLTFTNRSGLGAGTSGTGSGQLNIVADTVEIGPGTYSLDGFNQLQIAAAGALFGNGQSDVTIAANTQIFTPQWIGGNAADSQIDASGFAFEILNHETPVFTGIQPGFGARFDITADQLDLGTHIKMPSGAVDLRALNGDLNLLAGAYIGTPGSFIEIGRAFGQSIGIAGPAGSVSLAADTGNVNFANGATVDFSSINYPFHSEGQFVVDAAQGGFLFEGQLLTSGLSRLDRLSVNVDSLGQSGLSGFLGKISTIPIRQIEIEQGSGDLNLGVADSIVTSQLRLETLNGSIDVEGSVNVSGADGGRLQLIAGNEIILRDTAFLGAQGLTGEGGTIKLASLDRNGGGLGGLTIESGATVELSGATKGGQLYVQVPRVDSDNNGEDDQVLITGTLVSNGAAQTTVEGLREYVDDSVDAADLLSWQSDANSFMANVTGTLGAGIEIIPGVLVRSAGDLNLNTQLDFLPAPDSPVWRYGELPGALTLQAAGNLNINQSITDGFAPDKPNPGPRGLTVNNVLQPGRSWSYHLEAKGDVNLAVGQFIRTGTGDIEVSAGGNIVYGSQASSIYSAGRQTTQSIELDPNDHTKDVNGNTLTAAQIADNPYGTFNGAYAVDKFYAEYPVDGGDVRLTAGGDILGKPTDQFINDWLVRIGTRNQSSTDPSQIPTAWGIAIDRPAGKLPVSTGFQQSVGAFGGGSVYVRAGGNINDLSVVLPTTGKQVSPVEPDNPLTRRGVLKFVGNTISINESGDLEVTAGRDIQGGLYYVGSGTGRIDSGGSILSSGDNVGLLLAMDDANLSLNSRGDINLSGIFNPNAVSQVPGTPERSYFFNYGSDSGVKASTIAGNTNWKVDKSALENRYSISLTNEDVEIVPPNLEFQAGRDIRIESDFSQFPSFNGQMGLIAGRDILLKKDFELLTISESDADISELPNIFAPLASAGELVNQFSPANSKEANAAVPVHIADTVPSVIAAGRDIVNQGGDRATFWLAESAIVRAGRDLIDTGFIIQNTRPLDISSIQTGRDLRYNILLDRFTGGVIDTFAELQARGPGKFYVLTGRDLDLGGSNGLTTTGNFFNPNLPDGGADLFVLSGLQSIPDFTDFSERYLNEGDLYDSRLVEFVGGNTSVSGALAAFNQLTTEEQLPLILEVFYNEIREGGRRGAVSQNRADYARGDLAISTLFPDTGSYEGDARVFFSRIYTVDGGDINILIPGGELNAGLAVAFSGAKPPSQLGIVAEQTGDINIFVRDDLQVNTSRVGTFGGGNILGWSNLANIDAGRGAKASVTVPPPTIVFDSDGIPSKVFPPTIAVSGIQAATTRDGAQGNVDLFAPDGVIDAGLAGIAGADVTVGAVAVLNADNISFSGSSVGVPLGSSTSIAVGLTGASNLATSTSKMADSTSRGIGNSKEKSIASAGFLKVEFLGFGT